MANALPLLVAVVIGVGGAIQISMLGALGRQRGTTEAAWISLLASVAGIATILAIRAARGDTPNLPTPFDRLPVQLVLVAAVAGLLVLSVRGLPPYFAITGLFGVMFITGAAILGPRLGVALFFGAVTLGTVVGAVVLDQAGAFGAEPLPVTAMRALGLALLFAGVVLVRSGS